MGRRLRHGRPSYLVGKKPRPEVNRSIAHRLRGRDVQSDGKKKKRTGGGVDGYAAEMIGRERESEGNLKFEISNFKCTATAKGKSKKQSKRQKVKGKRQKATADPSTATRAIAPYTAGTHSSRFAMEEKGARVSVRDDRVGLGG